jgi:HEAT repeat protein
MRPLVRNERSGCRRWAVHELGILRDPAALNDLIGALDDPEDLVRSEACTSLSMLGDVLADEPLMFVKAELVARSKSDPSAVVRAAAASGLLATNTE